MSISPRPSESQSVTILPQGATAAAGEDCTRQDRLELFPYR